MSWCVWLINMRWYRLRGDIQIYSRDLGLHLPPHAEQQRVEGQTSMVNEWNSELPAPPKTSVFLNKFPARYLSEVFIMLQGSFKQQVIQVINASSQRCYDLHIPPQANIKDRRQCRSHTLRTSQLTYQVTLPCRSCWQAIVRRLTSK